MENDALLNDNNATLTEVSKPTTQGLNVFVQAYALDAIEVQGVLLLFIRMTGFIFIYFKHVTSAYPRA